ncbi:restriction endonuclease [Campylobacter hyointestinalis subsp. lawsonii]|nr:restriction endonuclease [Campylobacter hyointestinalis subsp. lawsonii]
MLIQIKRKKWILYRHTNDFNLLCKIAKLLKSFSKTTINKSDKEKLNLHLKKLGLYKERNSLLPLDSISHNINQLSYYMFGYQDKKRGLFMFSPLGSLLLKHLKNDNYKSKIFLAMLWGFQFAHPHSSTDKSFNLYPFRLIFKLLCDERLCGKLYAYEVALLVVFVQKIDIKIYKKLVDDILELRNKSNTDIEKLFIADGHTLVNSAYEWDYYTSEFLSLAGVIKKYKGEVICKLKQGNTNTFRKITRNYIEIPDYLLTFTKDLENENSFLQIPLSLDSKDRLKIDIIKEIYSFYPKTLLKNIGEDNNEGNKYLELPKLIEQYSKNQSNSTYNLFENVLCDGFNMFYNVEARKLSGAGHTDIECLYITKKKKFAVEAKSTANKLTLINTSRLREHRDEIGAKYTIIITPNYVPAAKRDIAGSDNVIILANTFAEFLFNSISNDIRELDYDLIDNIIIDNLGDDISEKISTLSLEKFGVISNDKYNQ